MKEVREKWKLLTREDRTKTFLFAFYHNFIWEIAERVSHIWYHDKYIRIALTHPKSYRVQLLKITVDCRDSDLSTVISNIDLYISTLFHSFQLQEGWSKYIFYYNRVVKSWLISVCPLINIKSVFSGLKYMRKLSKKNYIFNLKFELNILIFVDQTFSYIYIDSVNIFTHASN
jgi:hypothetical protein